MRLAPTPTGLALLLAALALSVGPADARSGPPPGPVGAPTCKGRPVTMLGTDGDDRIRGTQARDVILALGGDDRVDGRGGNDVICGGAGRDLLLGGSGADKIFGGADGRADVVGEGGERLMLGDVVQGGPGDDLIDLGFDPRQLGIGSQQRDRLSYKDSAFRVLVTLGGPGERGHSQGDGRDVIVRHPFLTLLGSDRGDVLTGSPYGDELLGRAGADVVDGAGGRDLLVDGPVSARVGDDELVGGIGRDVLTSWGGHDRLDGGSSADQMTAAYLPAGRTTILGGPGADRITLAGLRRDTCPTVVGGTGDDELLPSVAAAAHDARVDVDLERGALGVRVRSRVCGAVATVERLTMDNPFTGGPAPRWHVRGSSAAETVTLTHGASVWASMSGGADRVSGSTGNDNLRGGPGDDRLYGGGGRDVANGGGGTDVCRAVTFRTACEIPAG